MYRNGEGKGRTLAGFAFEPDAAAVQLDKTLGEGQTEAGALLLARIVAADLAEFFEYRLLIVRGDTYASVRDRDLVQVLEQMRRSV